MPNKGARTHTNRFRQEARAFREQCERTHAVCWLCGMPIDYQARPNTTDDSFNLDHYYPVSKRPDLQDDPAGFRPSHTSCNRLRGNRDPRKPLGMLSRQWIEKH